MAIPLDRIEEGIDNNDGYCVNCQDITNIGGVEGDAENYPCEMCGQNEVYGIEQALLLGLLE